MKKDAEIFRQELERCLSEVPGLRDSSLSQIAYHSRSLFDLYKVELELDDGTKKMLACKLVKDQAMARSEAQALQAIAASGTRVPHCYGCFCAGQQHILLMDFIQAGGRMNSADLRAQLELLYKQTYVTYGWPQDNFIGSLVQLNAEYDSFENYWLQSRIEPQLKMARQAGQLDASLQKQTLSTVEKMIQRWNLNQYPARLLHGDLWSGNILISASGLSYLIDPSIARGNPEQDLAMLCMFGQPLATNDLAAISAGAGNPSGFQERIAFWQIYPILVHINIFGGSYVASLRKAIQSYT